MPPSLSMTPPAATLIGGDLSLQTCEGWTTYFANLVPIDRHAAEDVRAGQIRMARLHHLIPFQIHNHPRCAFQAAAALTIAQSRLMMDVMRAGCSEKYVHAWSTALRASSTVGKSLFARKFDFK